MTLPALPRPVAAALALVAVALAAWFAVEALREPPPDRRIVSVAVSATGKWVAAGTAGGRIAIWSAGGAPRYLRLPRGPLYDLAFSPSEDVLAIAGPELELWRPEGGEAPRPLRAAGPNYGCVRFSADGASLVAIAGSGEVEVIDAASGASRVRICCSTVYGEVAFTPDGRSIAVAGHRPSLWDAGTGRLLARLTPEREFHAYRPIAFDEPRGTLLMGSQDGCVHVWDLATGRPLALSPPQPDYVETIALTASGAVAYAASGRALRLWNPATGELRQQPAARPTSNVAPVAGGRLLCFGTAEGRVECWDAEARTRVRALAGL